MRLRRRNGLPDTVRSALSLARGERVLTASPLAPPAPGGTIGSIGLWAVATERALHLPTGQGEWHVLPWQAIARAHWDADESVLHVEEVSGEGPAAAHAVPLAVPSLLPETVRERVTASIVVSRHVRLSPAGGVRIVARRVPGGGEPQWQLTHDPGLDPDDPQIRVRTSAALDELRRQTFP